MSALPQSVSPSARLAATCQRVPLIDMQRQYAELGEEIMAAVGRVMASGRYVLGPECEQLEKLVAAYCQAPHAIGCASGSDALLLALMAGDIGPGDEVVVPSYTFFATASAVTRLGARPVFADIDPTTYNICPRAAAAAVSPRTRAIIPVHLFGRAADMAPLEKLAERHGLLVIEDACQAIGAEYHGRRVGSIGHVGCFSFYPTKNLGGPGDGGLLTATDDRLADRLRLLRVHGMQPRYYHQVVGINSRLDTLQAAVLCVKMAQLDRWTAMRQLVARRYHELFAEHGLAERLGLPSLDGVGRCVWNQFVVRVPSGQRDALRAHLAEQKVGTEIYYPVPLHQQQCFAFLGCSTGDLPETERAARETIALPIFPEITAAEQAYVVDRIAAFYAAHDASAGKSVPRPKFLDAASERRQSA